MRRTHDRTHDAQTIHRSETDRFEPGPFGISCCALQTMKRLGGADTGTAYGHARTVEQTVLGCCACRPEAQRSERMRKVSGARPKPRGCTAHALPPILIPFVGSNRIVILRYCSHSTKSLQRPRHWVRPWDPSRGGTVVSEAAGATERGLTRHVACVALQRRTGGPAWTAPRPLGLSLGTKKACNPQLCKSQKDYCFSGSSDFASFRRVMTDHTQG